MLRRRADGAGKSTRLDAIVGERLPPPCQGQLEKADLARSFLGGQDLLA